MTKEERKERFWDKEKTMKKPILTTGDVALSESEEATKKTAQVMAEIKKSKEKENERKEKRD